MDVTAARTLTRSWDADAAHIAEARRFVTTELTAHGHAPAAPIAILVVSELATNAIVHAGGPFRVTLDIRHDSVLLTVTDTSPRLPVQRVAMAHQDRGRGLGIVAAVSEAWGVTTEPDGGKSVWASIPTSQHDGLRRGDGPGRRFEGSAFPAASRAATDCPD